MTVSSPRSAASWQGRHSCAHGSAFRRCRLISCSQYRQLPNVSWSIRWIGVAAGKMRTGEAKDGLDLNSGAALQEQVLATQRSTMLQSGCGKAFSNMPSLHTTLVHRGSLCGAGWATIGGGPVNREGRGRMWYRLPDGLQQRFGAGRQARTGVNKFYPRGVAVQGASCGSLIGESGEPSQVASVGTGGITSIGPRQPLAGSARHLRFQRENTEANSGLQMVRTGLQDHTRVMPLGAHVLDHARPRNIQNDQNVACVLLSTVGLNIHVATFHIASAQKPNRGRAGQLVGGPEPFARKGPMSPVVNQTDEVQLVRHCRQLPANVLQSDPESAVVHDRNSVAATKRRTMDFRQTARCVLTGCLSPGGRSILRPSPRLPPVIIAALSFVLAIVSLLYLIFKIARPVDIGNQTRMLRLSANGSPRNCRLFPARERTSRAVRAEQSARYCQAYATLDCGRISRSNRPVR
jgi:hypothetical protein